MTEAQTILKMIEEVDPADAAKLNTLDALVWLYLNSNEYPNDPERYIEGVKITYNGGEKGLACRHKRYTRSRDALKAIRPEGKIMWSFFENYPEGSRARAEIFHDQGNNPIQTVWLPTEELAELHVIIQAIEHERQHDVE